ITVFASSLSAASFSAASALALSAPAISMSNTLPWRTLATPSTPSDFSAPSMALPCGSRMPVFNVTVTRAFTVASLDSRLAHDLVRKPVPTFRDHALAFHQHRTSAGRPFVLHEDAEPLGDLR